MANYIVSYDLNGILPTHAEMDRHLSVYTRGRILETVWYVKSNQTMEQVFNYIETILTVNDRLIVIDAADARVRNLLIGTEALQKAWSDR